MFIRSQAFTPPVDPIQGYLLAMNQSLIEPACEL
jgi:hypothetical protein